MISGILRDLGGFGVVDVRQEEPAPLRHRRSVDHLAPADEDGHLLRVFRWFGGATVLLLLSWW